MTDFTISGLPAGRAATIEIRAVNAIGPAGPSDAKTATPSDVPGAFGPADWNVAAGEGAATLSVTRLPPANGRPVTGIDYRLDGGGWTASGLGGTGSFAITGLTGGRAYTVTLRARNANGAGVSGDDKTVTPTASGTGTDPNVTAVLSDGWRATYTTPPADFDPVGDPKHVVVERQGFDALGAPVTRADTLTLMARTREPYPNEGTLTPGDVALSDFVYQGDTVPGVANTSTQSYPKPVAMWLDHDLRRVRGGSYTARLAVAHAHARAGRPVAAVKFIATDGTSSVETVVSSMTVTAYAASGLSVPHFAGALDFSGLAADALITIDAVIYPWVGEAFTVSVEADPYPSPNLTVLKVFNDVSYGTAYAYVAPGASGGTASGTAATAEADPFPTIAAAASALQSYNSATFGRNSASGGVIRLEEGTHVHSGYPNVVVAGTAGHEIPLEIEAVGAKAATVYQDAGASIANGMPDLLKIRGVTLRKTAGNNIFIDSAASSAHVKVLEDCALDLNGNSLYQAWVYRPGRLYLIGVEGDDVGQAHPFGNVYKAVVALGSTAAGSVRNNTYQAAGCNCEGLFIAAGSPVSAIPPKTGAFLGWSRVKGAPGSTTLVIADAEVGPRGLALVGNVVELYSGYTGPAMRMLADGNTMPGENIVKIANTVIGQRTNWLYQDTGSVTIAKSGCELFNIDQSRNTKSDVFGQDGNLVGNWPAIYRVGARSNAAIVGATSGAGYATGSWLGEVPALGEVNGSSASPLATDFADDRSDFGAGGGNGDYTPGPGHALPLIPTGLAPYPVDQKGRTVTDDGTAVAGALQPG